MPFEQLGRERDALFCWDVRKSNETGVWNTMQVNECTEVRVYSDEDTILAVGLVQQRSISGVRVDFQGLKYVVTAVTEPFCQPAASTAVNEKFQRPFTDTAASVSPAITARA